MQEISINIWALVAAALIRVVLGAVWFSPAAFRPRWRAIVGLDEAKVRAGLPKAIAVDVVGALIMAFVLVHAVVYAGATTVGRGAVAGFFNWLGFIAVVQLSATRHEHRPLAYFAINSGYNLIALVLMGAVLAIWR